MNKRPAAFFALLLISIVLFLLACRTANILSGAEASPTTTPRSTRAALRPTFTPFPTDTEIPPPTETPEPTDTPEPTQVPPTATRRPPTARPPTARPTQPPATPIPATPVPSPTVYFAWTTTGSTTCEGGGDTESSVSGKITANNKGAVGQRVQASSGPGGSPISDYPAMSDSNGNYKVTFICGGKACNGDFWIWMVDADKHQISPFVKFHFDGGCRKGTQNFVKR